jgi:hypothetical protein
MLAAEPTSLRDANAISTKVISGSVHSVPGAACTARSDGDGPAGDAFAHVVRSSFSLLPAL